MTDDQRYVLQQLVDAVQTERPDAVIIAGDLYDRAVPPTEAVDLLDDLFEKIVMELQTPVLAIAGNHDSPDRLDFATRIMEGQGLYLAGQLKADLKPVVLSDQHGEVHVYLVPYADPAQVRYILADEAIRTHDDAARAIVSRIEANLDPNARHIYVGHAFVTPGGQSQDNTSDSERPLAVGGAEHVHAEYFARFHYAAFGHLHQAHYVLAEHIRYAGSPLKYSISEEHHKKGYYMVEMDGQGKVQVEKRDFKPLRELRRITAKIEEIEQTHTPSDDYVFITLTNEHPVLFPMEKVRAVYPNALHVERRVSAGEVGGATALDEGAGPRRSERDPSELFAAFYQEVTGLKLDEEKKELFMDTYQQLLKEEGERA